MIDQSESEGCFLNDSSRSIFLVEWGKLNFYSMKTSESTNKKAQRNGINAYILCALSAIIF